MTASDLERLLRAILTTEHIEEPGLESRWILEEVLDISPIEVLARGGELIADAKLEEKAIAWAKKRATGYPLAYILGSKGFYKSRFYLEPGVLIPRPETEFVVTEALRIAKGSPFEIEHFADLGSGSGCLGLSVLLELPGAQLSAVDLSPQANRVTHENALRFKLRDRVKIISSAVLEWKPKDPLDLVVANPPYIAEGDLEVETNVHMHEPHLALYSGADGLKAICEWTEWAYQNLRPSGGVVFEFGASQSAKVQAIMSAAGFEDIQIIKDFSGYDRVISGLKSK